MNLLLKNTGKYNQKYANAHYIGTAIFDCLFDISSIASSSVSLPFDSRKFSEFHKCQKFATLEVLFKMLKCWNLEEKFDIKSRLIFSFRNEVEHLLLLSNDETLQNYSINLTGDVEDRCQVEIQR